MTHVPRVLRRASGHGAELSLCVVRLGLGRISVGFGWDSGSGWGGVAACCLLDCFLRASRVDMAGRGIFPENFPTEKVLPPSKRTSQRRRKAAG